jgi:hypothetical protein
MNYKISAALVLGLVFASPSVAQQGGTFTPDTTTSQGTNSGGPVGSQAVDRPKTATPNDVGKRGNDCEQMSGTVSAQRPATAGQQTPQPQAKC